MKLDKFINRPVLSTVISILIVILGLIGLATLPITQYPDIAPPTVSVRATYQGANAQTVLNSVIAPLEDQINGVENMMYMTSSASNNGSAEISIYFKQGTDPDMAAVNVQNRVSMAQGLLPAEVTKVGVTTQKRQTSMLMVFSIYDEKDQYDIEFLENYANINLIPEVKRVNGVGDATVLGQDYSMRIWLKPDVMAQYKLIPNDVAGALAEQNIEAAPGQFGERGNQSFQYTIRYKGRLQQPEEFENIVIKALENGEVLRKVKAYMQKNQIRPYNEEHHSGIVRHILIRTGYHTKEIMVCLIVNAAKASCLKNAEQLTESLREMDGMTSVMVNFNTEKTNLILGKKSEVLWGQPYIEDFIGDVKYQISPQSFFQVNPMQTEKLYAKALEYAGLTGKETVWDLYCGIGTISLFLAGKAKKVCGVEIIPQAIDDARENAKRNHIENAEFFVGKAEEVLPEFYEKAMKEVSSDEMLHPDVIVVDPPRKGCDDACLNTMLRMQPERIVYVSCDSATLARDLKILCDGGYEIRKVQGVDQFGMTVHVESVVLMQYCGK